MFESVVLLVVVFFIIKILESSFVTIYEGSYGVLFRNGIGQRDSDNQIIKYGPGKHFIRFWSDHMQNYRVKETLFTVTQRCEITSQSNRLAWDTAIEYIVEPGCPVYHDQRDIHVCNVFSQVIMGLRSEVRLAEENLNPTEFLVRFSEMVKENANATLSQNRIKIIEVRLVGYTLPSPIADLAEGGVYLQISKRK